MSGTAVAGAHSHALDVFARRARRRVVLFIVLVALLFASAIASIMMGQYSLPMSRVPEVLFNGPSAQGIDASVVWNIRLPRIVLGLLVGAALGVAGALMQAVFANPLAEPSVIGVNSGAGVGAAIAIVFEWKFLGASTVAFAAFITAVLTTTVVYQLARYQGRVHVVNLILTGIAINAVCGAAISFMLYLAPTTNREQIIFWQMGSLQDVRAEALTQFALVAVPCILLLLAMRWRINILSLGDDEARTLGITLTRTRGITILLATLVTATSVCIGGPISWVGLVIPHLCRLLVGSDTTKLMPLSILMGASFMMFVDTLARSLTSAEVPLSVLTGFIGTPLYVALLLLGKVRVK